MYGFRKLFEAKFSIKPFLLQFSFELDSLGFKRNGINQLWKFCGKNSRNGFSDFVGRYVINDKETSIIRRIAIDPTDGWEVSDFETYEWSNLYFKDNYWPSMQYPKKVRPFISGDGFLPQKLHTYLKRLRTFPKTIDLYYFTRLWEPGITNYWTKKRCRNVIEYQIRLYETLSRLSCSKTIAVILPQNDLRSINKNEVIKRLSDVGVQFINQRIPYEIFWKKQSSSKIVFVRPGDHNCISFRVSGLLNTGSCIVYDGEPFVQWYEPLILEVHFVHGKCRLGRDYTLPDDSDYEGILTVIDELLSNPNKMDFLRQNAAQYFDNFASPQKAAGHIIRTAFAE